MAERKGGPMNVSPDSLSLETRVALMALKRALADEGFFDHAQVTFDHVNALDVPPTITVIPMRNLRAVKD